MKQVYFDFETYSKKPLKEYGAYEYANDVTTDVLCLAVIHGTKKIVWYPGDKIPASFKTMFDGKGKYIGHNIWFDVLIWNHVFIPKYWKEGPKIKMNQCICTMALAYMKSYSGAMEKVANELNLPMQKFKEGRRAMLELTRKGREAKNFNEKLMMVGTYCLGDVEITKMIYETLGPFDNGPDNFEDQLWLLTNAMNERGIKVDRAGLMLLLEAVNKFNTQSDKLVQKLSDGVLVRKDLNRTEFFKNYLRSNNVMVENVQRETLEALLSVPDDVISKNLKSLITLKINLSQASIKKIVSMLYTSETSSRVHGALQYHGAHTGRWAGRLIQPQNFPRNTFSMDEFSEYMGRVKTYVNKKTTTLRDIKILVDMPKALRPLIIADPGKVLVTADYAQIEARVLAWIAGQTDVVKLFERGEDIYCAMASTIYNKKVNKKDHPTERQVGKTAILGLGFGMGADRFKDTVFNQTGIVINEREAKKVVNIYRTSYDKIEGFWKHVEAAFQSVYKKRKDPLAIVYKSAGVTLWYAWDKNIDGIVVTLPSGRNLYYPQVTLDIVNDWKCDMKYLKGKLYGGLITENIVQSVARDIMGTCMIKMNTGLMLTVHDENVWEVKERPGLAELYEKKIVNSCPTWFNKKLIKNEIAVERRYGK